MKLENCGRCGLAAEMEQPNQQGKVELVNSCRNDGAIGVVYAVKLWNKKQRRIRTERINAAALAIFAGQFNGVAETLNQWPDEAYAVERSTLLIDAQDAAAQARFAEAQGGE